MNLFEYYQQTDKNKFIDLAMSKCKVKYPTVRSWVATIGSAGHRTPTLIYRPILSKITGIPEDVLFKKD
jgi:hypothetical protein